MLRPCIHLAFVPLLLVATTCQTNTTPTSTLSPSPPSAAALVPGPDSSTSTAPVPTPTHETVVSPAAFATAPPPASVTTNNPELSAFIRRVISYAQRRQREQLVAVADDSIVISYGGGVFGKKAFAAYLNDQRNDSYAGIIQALQLGGTGGNYDETPGRPQRFYFPYFQDSNWKNMPPAADVDPFITYIGLGPQVKIYEKPSRQSRVLTTLAYPILFADYATDQAPKTPAGWITLKTPNGKIQGSVEESAVYCNAAMTLVIEQKQGIYKILSVAPFD